MNNHDVVTCIEEYKANVPNGGQVLFACATGSTLYGTRTATSDVDIKIIYLPSITSLLLGKKVHNTSNKTNNSGSKNSKDDIDCEYIPLQTFANDFIKGQTYALELAFAASGKHAYQQAAPSFISFTQSLTNSWLTKDIKAMTGYVVNQAHLYAAKAQSLSAITELLTVFTSYAIRCKSMALDLNTCRVQDMFIIDEYRTAIEALTVKYDTHVAITEYEAAQNKFAPCLRVNGRTVPLTNSLLVSIDQLRRMNDKYGDRVKTAVTEGSDWKAMAHAYRITCQAVELLERGTITLPLSPANVENFLAIRRGEVSQDTLTTSLNASLEKIKVLADASTRPAYGEDYQHLFDVWFGKVLKALFYDIPTEKV